MLKLSIYIEVFEPKLFKLGALPEMNNIYDENHLDHALVIAKEAVLIAHDADSDSRYIQRDIVNQLS